MGMVEVRYYSVRNGRGYWQPSKAMKAEGFAPVACGPDGPAAWAVAQTWNDRWDAAKKGSETSPKPEWPSGSFGHAFKAYQRSNTWAEKAPRTREDWHRGWRYIAPIFGDVKPSTVTFEVIDAWYADVKREAGVREAHRAMKIWRALWNVAAAQSLCERGKDPSLGVRRETPRRRKASWKAEEVVACIARAWRAGYRGLALAVSIAWDTGLSPVDVRTLTHGELDDTIGRFGGVVRERAKTGQEAIGVLSRRSRWMLDQVAAGTTPLPSAPLMRTKRGALYTKNSLAQDFRAVRGEGETRRIMDIRRSAAIEARSGGATKEQVASMLANRVDANSDLEQTYMPPDSRTAELVAKVRAAARRRTKAGGKSELVQNDAGTPILNAPINLLSARAKTT